MNPGAEVDVPEPGSAANPTSAAQPVLDALAWFGPEALAATASAPLTHALCAPGLLVDTIERIYGEPPDVCLRGQRWFDFGQERHIELVVRGSVLIEAYSLLPRDTVQAHPWLASLGDEALGLALRRHGFVDRGPYSFAYTAFPLLPDNDAPGESQPTEPGSRAAGLDPESTPKVLARRFSFIEPQPAITVVEVFSQALLTRLASGRHPHSHEHAQGEV